MGNMNNEKRISLWYNDKRTQDNQPHLKGSMELAGEKYWVSLWIQTDSADNSRNDNVLDNCIKMLMRLFTIRERRPVVTGSIELAESANITPRRVEIPDALPVDDIPF